MTGTEDSLFRIGEKVSHLFHGSIPEILSETVFHAGLFFLDFQVGRMKALEGVKQIKLPVREKPDVLAESCRRRLEELGCEVIRPIGECTPVVSFTVPGYTPEETGDILSGSYDIICRVGLHCAPDILEDIRKPRGSVRLSFSRFSTKEELDIVLEAVEAMRESL